MKRYISFALSALCVQAFGADCDLKNGITSGQTCTLVNDTTMSTDLINSGTLILNPWTDLTLDGASGKNDFQITSSTLESGTIKVLGYSTIDAKDKTNTSISVSKQNISIDKRLTFSANSLRFGDGGKVLFSSASPASSAELTITIYTNQNTNNKIEFVNTAFKNITTTISEQKQSGTGTENKNKTLSIGTLDLNSSKILSSDNLSIQALDPASTNSSVVFKLQGSNRIALTGEKSELTIKKGIYEASGGGNLSFESRSVNLEGGVVFKGVNSTEAKDKKTSIAFRSEDFNKGIYFNDLKATDLTLQISGVLKNSKLELDDSTIRAFDSNGVIRIESQGNTLGNILIANGAIKADVTPKNTSTISAKDIQIYGQEIDIGRKSGEDANLTLSLETNNNAGTISLGRVDDATTTTKGSTSIVGNHTSNKQALQIGASKVSFGNATLKNLAIAAQSSGGWLQFVGGYEEEKEGKKEWRNGTLILDGISLDSRAKNGEGKYQAIGFVSGKEDQKSTIQIIGDTVLKASKFAFQNQDIDLTSGKALDLYAYGAVDISVENSPKEVGVFTFDRTTITSSDTNASNFKLYSSGVGADLKGTNLTLRNVNLTSYKIGTTDKTSLNLSINEMRALGKVSIDASRLGQDSVGSNIIIGSDSESGALELKSESEAENFKIGNLTIHNLKSTSSVFDITSGQKSLSNGTLGLVITGELRVLHGKGAQNIDLKAKNFIFDPSSISGSSVTSAYGSLGLIVDSSVNEVEIKGKTILIGNETAVAGIKTFKGDGSTEAILSLHDIEVRGKATLGEKTTFNASNLTIGKEREVGGELKITNTKEAIKGIQSIALNDATLNINNGSGNQGLILSQNATIASKGVSSIQAPSLDVDSGGTFALNIKDGTLTITESVTKNAIGAITLGSAKVAQDTQAIGAKLKLSDTLKIQDTITSYGDSSIEAGNFAMALQPRLLSDPIFSVNDGELALIANQSFSSIDIAHEISLNNGILAVYTKEDKNKKGSMTLDKNIISSKGTSQILGDQQGLKIFGSTIVSDGGKLTLTGLSNDSSFNDIVLRNAGSLRVMNDALNTDLRLSGSLIMTSNTPYIKTTQDVRGFGTIEAKSLLFTGAAKRGEKLIALKVDGTSDNQAIKMTGEKLFDLREGENVLIQTTEGIKKQIDQLGKLVETNITYDDIATDLGDYKSLTLTPILKCKEGSESDCGASSKNLMDSQTPERPYFSPNPAITNPVLSLALDIKVKQNNIEEVIDQLSWDKRNQVNSFLSSGRYREIANSILGSDGNPYKVGIIANLLNDIGGEGKMELALEALTSTSEAFDTMASLVQTNHKIFEQISSLTFGTLQNRMARATNPHSADSGLTSLISSVRYASTDDELPLEEETTNSNAELGGLWVNYDGVMRNGRNVNSSINGLSVGYDAIVGDNALIGAFMGYLYGAYNGEFLYNSSHNLHFGLYSRLFFGGNEIDLVFSQIVAFNQASLNVGQSAIASQLNGDVNGGRDFKMYASDFQMRYGYAFSVGNEESPYYLKPLIGLGISYLGNDAIKVQDAINPISAEERYNFRFDLSAGLELRKYFNEGSYIYVLPMVEAGIFNLGNDTEVGFIGAKSLSYKFDSQKDISVGIYAGGEGKVAENLAISGGMGLKMGVKTVEVITSWNVGVKYHF